MNKKKIGIVLGILLVFLLILFLNPKEKPKEENILYSKQFENAIYLDPEKQIEYEEELENEEMEW